MKAMMLTGLKQIEMIEVPTPKITNEFEVLIKMTVLGVCGSDVHYYESGRIGSQIVKFPFTLGHEGAGIVESIGEKVTNVNVGDRIAVEPAMPCWECDQCLVNRSHTCRNLKFLGCPKQASGCLSEYIVMPETSCFKIPESMSYDEASISEPLAIGLYAVKQSIPMKNVKVGILGSGPIGLSVLLSAQAKEADAIYMTDKIDSRLNLAKKMGAKWIGNPNTQDIVQSIHNDIPELLDVVFECCGSQDALSQAIDILKPGGKLMIIGIPPTLDNWQLPVDKMRHKEICVQNVRRQNHSVQEALDLIANKKIDVTPMITHRFNFADTAKAFDIVNGYKDNAVKVMIDY